jgi:hypothetical protein
LVASLQDLGVFEAGSAQGLTTFRTSAYRFAGLSELAGCQVRHGRLKGPGLWAVGVVAQEPVQLVDEESCSHQVKRPLSPGSA